MRVYHLGRTSNPVQRTKNAASNLSKQRSKQAIQLNFFIVKLNIFCVYRYERIAFIPVSYTHLTLPTKA